MNTLNDASASSSRSKTEWLRFEHWLPWLVLGASLLITWQLWQYAKQKTVQELHSEFNFRVQEADILVEQRMKAYEQSMRGVAGLFASSKNVGRAEFHEFVSTLHLEKDFSGIESVSFAPVVQAAEKAKHIDAARKGGFPEYTIKPEGERESYAPVIYFEAFTPSLPHAFGFDNYSNSEYRAVMGNARDSGDAGISCNIKSPDEKLQAGCLMFLPVYQYGVPHDTLALRRANLSGWVVSLFRMHELMRGILGERSADLDVEIFDGRQIAAQAMMYDDDGVPRAGIGSDSLLQSINSVEFVGHSWIIAISSLPSLEAQLEKNEPRIIGYTGIVTGILLALLTWLMLRERVQTLQLLESKTRYQQMFDDAAAIAFLLDPDSGCIVDANAAASAFWGYTRDELRGMDISQINVAPREEVHAALKRRQDNHHIELRHKMKSGEIRDVEVYSGPLIIQGRSLLYAVLHDITERKRVEEALRENESKYRLLFETAGDGIFLLDSTGFIVCNEQGNRMYGISRAEVIGRSPADFSPEKQPDGRLSAEVIGEKLTAVMNGEPQQFEWRFLRSDGVPFDVEITLNRIEFGGTNCVQAVVRDITERKRAHENLRIIASVFDNSQEAIVITSVDNIITDVNQAFTNITGYSREEVVGHDPKLLSSGRQDKDFYAAMWQSLKQNKTWRGEIWNRRKSGAIYAELLSIAAICDDAGAVQRYVAVFSDISRLKEHEAELSHFANYDALTGMPNRRLLADRLSQAIVRAQRTGRMLFVCYIDLDGFKQVNDQHGHEVGDRLLVDITRRLQDALRAGDTLARLGGDEFVMLFNDFARDQECFQLLDRVLDIVAMPIIISGHEIKVSASIGVTFFPHDNEDAETLMRHADQAMYVAKQSGRNRYHLYDPEHDQRVRILHESRRRILHGLDNGEFELYYQPKIELITGKVAGVEALIRWHHTERGLLLPEEFLPFLEESDIEIRLGAWVMDTALAQLDAWNKEGLALEVSINISARHLQSPDFVSELKRKLARYPHLPHASLQIEVLETAALEDINLSSETINECRELGVNFALDDFGTGYSSLAYLSKLSAGTLKIDQSFVRGMLSNEGDHAIVQGIVALAKTFGRKTVAEGMESPELTPALIAIGCTYGQGFDLARPMPGKDFLKWYNNKHA